MRQHIHSVCRTSFLELRRAASIRPYFSQSATARLVAAMVISRLDYYNSVFAGLPADQVARLQRIQNNATRLVMQKRKRDHVTPLLKELHWLSVKFRCRCKIATLAYRHLRRVFTYVSFFIPLHLRTISVSPIFKRKLLKIPKQNLKSFGERSFSFMAPSLRNSLPADLRNLPPLS